MLSIQNGRHGRPGLLASALRGARYLALAAGLSIALAACGGGGGDDDDGGGGGGPTPPTPVVGTVAGKVTSAVDSSAIAGATVSNNGVQTTTAADGTFTLAGLPPSARTVIRINAAGFGEGLKTTDVVADSTVTIAAQLTPVDATTTAPATTAIVLAAPNSPARVELPASGLVRADGSPATGNVTVSLTAVDPALDVNAMPGEYMISTGGLMESWGAINVTLEDSAGERLNLGAGKTATIRIPVATRNPTLPATIPLFFFNETTGLWEEQGTATLAGTAPDQYYEGTVSHFTYWNADMVMDTIFVQGCVADEGGAPAADAIVTIDGIDYSSSSSARTGADGRFRIPMKKSAQATLTASQGVKLSNTVSLEPSATDIDRTNACLTLVPSTTAVSVKLTWGALPADVDSHLFAPDGSHVFYSEQGSLTQAPYASLDVDDTSGFGPEVVTIRRLMVGTYTYAVHNYSGTYTPGMTDSPVRIELNRGGAITVFSPPAGEVSGSTDWWTVFTMTVDAACNVTVSRIGTWNTAVAGSPTSQPTYCTAPAAP